MKLTVLTDNNTIIDRYLLGEPALSFYLEDDGQQLLFDVGYSDVLIKNAQTLGIDLAQIPRIVISHGHDDHTRGLQALHRQGLLVSKTVIAHPDAFSLNLRKNKDICWKSALLIRQMLYSKFAHCKYPRSLCN